jgi:uncharacterized membrane protein
MDTESIQYIESMECPDTAYRVIRQLMYKFGFKGVVWSAEDIVTVLESRLVEPTGELLDAVMATREWDYSIDAVADIYGWEFISDAVTKVTGVEDNYLDDI